MGGPLDTIRTAFYIHGRWGDGINFCCFYICHSTMGLTRC